ncbi:hypothetical protein [Rhodoligotrophos defluvii]|uniref:hypothetical protein n=1 Tax=Rhodoligotrophos defluvii TaxID=2561934 RepID=UPI0010C9BB1A|nr:hypothetical protein [Rhodoligotrophos defluvii]
MKHRTVEEIRPVGMVVGEFDYRRAVRRTRLERLAALLEEKSGVIKLLSGIEFMSRQERLALRADNSPLALAYADPVFRAQGLKSDKLGDAIAFFELSQREAHDLFCDCHYHSVGGITAQAVADRARSIARRTSLRDVWSKLRNVFAVHRLAAGR